MLTKGFTDIPRNKIIEDKLEIKNYIIGLSDFIVDCPTPMTISIQGDWGSGKTSFMNMIKDNLEKNEDIDTIWFNTWQFSQFNLGDSLSIIFLSKLLDKMTEGDEKTFTNNLKKYLSVITKTTARVASSAVSAAIRVDIKETTEKVINEVNDINDEDVIKIISELKNEFKKCVEKILEYDNKKRLVIFIDDLDRINPEKAIEILEVLKIFLDCEKCVFILAIDYEVVIQGVKQKYGGALTDNKGRYFFDKIIQLPFKMPVAQYKIKEYLREILIEMNILENSEKDKYKEEIYYNLVRYSIGYNPRSIKRLFNGYMLLKIILEKVEQKTDEYYDRVLFAILCMQIAFEDVYNYIIMKSYDELNADFFKNISDYSFFENKFNLGNDDTQLWVKELRLLENEEETYKICTFMKVFCEAISTQNSNISNDDIQKVFEVFDITSITSVSDRISKNDPSSKSIRYDYEIEEEYRYYSLDDDIVKKNLPNGWNGAIIAGYKLSDEEVKVDSFSELVTSVLKKLYEFNPGKFNEIKDNPTEYGLTTLFLGVGKGGENGREIVSRGKVKVGEKEIAIEQKFSNNSKAANLRKIMQAIEFEETKFQIKAKLAIGSSRKNKIKPN